MQFLLQHPNRQLSLYIVQKFCKIQFIYSGMAGVEYFTALRSAVFACRAVRHSDDQ